MKDIETIKHMEMTIQRAQFRYLRNRLNEEGLYRGDPRLLMYVSLHDGQSQNQIAKRLCVKPASITVMIQRMEQAGLVRRGADLKDQRIQRVYITEEGEKVSRKTIALFSQATQKFYQGLTPEEVELYGQILKKIDRNVKALLGDSAEDDCQVYPFGNEKSLTEDLGRQECEYKRC